MTVTRLNPEYQAKDTPESVTLSTARTSVSANSNYTHCYRYGREVYVSLNIRDTSPSADAKLLSGFPPPIQSITPCAVSGKTGVRLKLTGDSLYWDYTNYNTEWMDAAFSYIAAS